jgi:hypothetical protein
MVAVWAAGDIHITVCADGSFPRGGQYVYPAGDEHGQYGWDIGVNYKSVPDLLTQLLPTPYRKIDRLALNEHGAPGTFLLRGAELTLESIATDQIQNTLRSIRGFLSPSAVVLLMACNCGAGNDGTAFLTKLSLIFSGMTVVGFKTVGFQMSQYRRGELCANPGLRDTDYDNPAADETAEIQRYGNGQYLKLPWASETSTHAKVARNGAIISGAEPQVAPTNYSPDAYLPGTWSVTIGDWRGYFLFKRSHEAAWTDESPTRRHPGKWWLKDGSVYWSFDDDPPGWQRIFEVIGPLKSTVNGGATINGVQHGFFTMSKQD